MKTADEWFVEYGQSHQNKTNKTIHWICIPFIVFSLLGMLMSLPVPAAMAEISPWLNWATVFSVVTLGWYIVLSVPLSLGMAAVVIPMLLVNFWLAQNQASLTELWKISLGIFFVAWVGQFYGHKIEGKKPSFFKDLQFLLVGPLWLLGFIYRKYGINY